MGSSVYRFSARNRPGEPPFDAIRCINFLSEIEIGNSLPFDYAISFLLALIYGIMGTLSCTLRVPVPRGSHPIIRISQVLVP